MAWLRGAWGLIKNLPALISVAKQVYDAYQDFQRRKREEALKAAFQRGLEEAKKKHNTQTLEDAINGKASP